MRPRKDCKMCEGLFKSYPENDNTMIAEYFPSVIERNQK
jgi:hypothetical protein